MSRLPRHLEHLRTAFTTEAVAAATFRSFAAHADGQGKPQLARRYRALAEEKDRLAIELLSAAGGLETEVANLRAAVAEERYETEVLYPRLVEEMEDLAQPAEAALLRRIIEAHTRHAGELDALRRELTATTADVREAAAAR